MMNQESRKAGKNLRERELTDRIISAAIRVHRELGPGFLENIYEEALAVEFALSGIQFIRQKPIEDGLLLNFATTPLTIKRFCRELPAQNELHDVAL